MTAWRLYGADGSTMHCAPRRPEAIMDYCERSAVRVLTLDLFDTLLLRNCKPEVHRFYEVSKLHRRFFRDIGHDIPARSLLSARLIAHKIGYRSAPLVGTQRDASVAHILQLYLHLLGIGGRPDTLGQLITMEVEYEKDNVIGDREAHGLADRFRSAGGDVFIISDMYLEAQHLEELVAPHFPISDFKRIYVSSQYSAGKSSGELYRIFLREQNLQARHALHVGDNPVADVQAALKVGMSALYRPRSLPYRGTMYGLRRLAQVLLGRYRS